MRWLVAAGSVGSKYAFDGFSKSHEIIALRSGFVGNELVKEVGASMNLEVGRIGSWLVLRCRMTKSKGRTDGNVEVAVGEVRAENSEVGMGGREGENERKECVRVRVGLFERYGYKERNEGDEGKTRRGEHTTTRDEQETM